MAKKIKVKKTKDKDIDTATQYFQSGNLQQAEALCRQILQQQPDYADAWHLFGLVAIQTGRYDNAIEYISKAVRLNPQIYLYYYNLGNAYAFNGLMGKAIVNFRKTIELRRDYPKAYINLGNALKEEGLLEEAIETYKRALILNPDSAITYYNLGNALTETGMVDAAVENYRKASALEPDHAMAYNNAGNILLNKGLIEDAIANYRKALTAEPENAEIHANLGMANLLIKDFERGWAEYEWTLKYTKVPDLRKHIWNGELLEGKCILVYAVYGYGDTLQFARYLPKLYEDYGAKKVLFIPQKGLEQLLRESDLKAEILDAETPVESLPYDTNIHLLSLPRIFGTNLENIPFKQKRYLKANPEKVAWYRSKFFTTPYPLPPAPYSSSPAPCTLYPATFKIGIFWQGNPALKPDRRRSMPLHHFYPLCRLPDVKVYSLQKGYGIEQLNDLPEDMEIVNLGETFNDFSDTAAAIMNLDLVITVDTAIGHLSGALGKKTWILLPSHAEWRWHLDMDYSPWYEDVKLFRHKELGKKDWGEMIRQVKEKVEEEIRNRRSM